MALRSQRSKTLRSFMVIGVALTFGSVPVWSALGAEAQGGVERVAEQAQLQRLEVVSYTAEPLVRATYTVEQVSAVGWPTYGNSRKQSDGFGARGGTHRGIDFLPGAGTSVASAAKGVVLKAGVDGSYGYAVTMGHTINGATVRTVYAHMIAGSVAVSAGQEIALGTHLGRVGSTGKSTGAHLHFEVHINGRAVNPLSWLNAHVNAGDWDWMLDK